MNPMRRTGLAAVAARAESAGTIASSNGSAIVTPMPRRKVLRGSDFLLMIMTFSPLLYQKSSLAQEHRVCIGIHRIPIHRCSAAATFGAGDGATALLIWNGMLFTMPVTSAEKR